MQILFSNTSSTKEFLEQNEKKVPEQKKLEKKNEEMDMILEKRQTKPSITLESPYRQRVVEINSLSSAAENFVYEWIVEAEEPSDLYVF